MSHISSNDIVQSGDFKMGVETKVCFNNMQRLVTLLTRDMWYVMM